MERAERTGSPSTGSAGYASAPLPTPLLVAESAYAFSLTSGVSQRFVGEVPGGYRIDFDYLGGPGSVSIQAGTSALGSARAHLVGASVLGGSDWVSVSHDAIVDFDSHITLLLAPGPAGSAAGGQAPEPPPRCPIAGRLRGRADLRDSVSKDDRRLFTDRDNAVDVLQRWRNGLGEQSYLPLVLSVAFDVPLEGFSERETQIFEDCRELGRCYLLGFGKAYFAQGPYGQVAKIELHLQKVGPQGLEAGTGVVQDARSNEQSQITRGDS